MEANVFYSNGYVITKVKEADIRKLAEFVVTENQRHHCAADAPIVSEEDSILSVWNEERAFSPSYLYIAKNNGGKIIGSIRVFKWDKKQQLPIEKIFGINPLTAIHNEPQYNYWHIGRFAIDSFSGISTLTLFKQLVFLSIKPIIEDTDSYMIAEMDSKLLRTLNALGIETIRLGESVQYLHSETIPVCAKREGLLYFYNKYKDILKSK